MKFYKNTFFVLLIVLILLVGCSNSQQEVSDFEKNLDENISENEIDDRSIVDENSSFNDEVCSEFELYSCKTKEECEGVNGSWIVETFDGEDYSYCDFACSTENVHSCQTEEECESVNGLWTVETFDGEDYSFCDFNY